MTLSEIVKNKRTEMNVSLQTLAAIIGVNYVTIWKIENENYAKLSYKTINRLSDWLGITPADFKNKYM